MKTKNATKKNATKKNATKKNATKKNATKNTTKKKLSIKTIRNADARRGKFVENHQFRSVAGANSLADVNIENKDLYWLVMACLVRQGYAIEQETSRYANALIGSSKDNWRTMFESSIRTQKTIDALKAEGDSKACDRGLRPKYMPDVAVALGRFVASQKTRDWQLFLKACGGASELQKVLTRPDKTIVIRVPK